MPKPTLPTTALPVPQVANGRFRPLFTYYGGKGRVVHKYPVPEYSTVIEPFAGSACYSLLYHSHDVILVEKYKVLFQIWNWFVEEATLSDAEGILNLASGESIEYLPVHSALKLLMGFAVNKGVASPCKVVTRWSEMDGKLDLLKTAFIYYLNKVKHWEVRLGCFSTCPDIEATWFIDPPYQKMGHLYIHNKIDYSYLREWCLSRRGQVIVCEMEGADWLPFKPFCENRGTSRNGREVIWTND